MSDTSGTAPDFTTMSPDQIIAYAKSQAGGSAAVGTGKPIGVPEGYTTTRTFTPPAGYKAPVGKDGKPLAEQAQGFTTAAAPPQYFDGAQYSIANLDPVALSQLQEQMRNAGLLKDGYVSGFGGDPATIAAYTELLTEANTTGYTAAQTLQNRLAAPQVAAAKAPKAPYTAAAYLKPDPATLRENVRDLMKQVVGPNREPTDAELDDLTGRLDSLDRQAYDASTAADHANYDASAAGDPGGAVIANTDPSARLADYLRTTYKPEIDMTKGTADLTANRDGLMGSIFAIDNAIKTPGL